MDKDTISVSLKNRSLEGEEITAILRQKKLNHVHCHSLEMNKEIKWCGGERRIIAQILYTCHLDLLRSEKCENFYISPSTSLADDSFHF